MIILLTPTGGRQRQFELCMQWMKQQTYSGKVVWVVIDDCEPKTTDTLTEDFRDTWSIIKRHPNPLWERGSNTQVRNLRIGIDIVKAFPSNWVEAIFIIEDDDYYKPEYLQTMVEMLQGYSVAGEIKTIYYNLKYKTYKDNANINHSSLFQTCFTVDAIPIFEKCLNISNRNNSFVDINFFKQAQNVNLFDKGKLAIGMKGMPGRAGIGSGHRVMGTRDSDLNKLKELIGEDYKFYQ